MQLDRIERVVGLLAVVVVAIMAGRFVAQSSVPRVLWLVALPWIGLMCVAMARRPHILGFVLLVIYYMNLDSLVSYVFEAHTAFLFVLVATSYIGLLFVWGGERLSLALPAWLNLLFFLVIITIAAVLPYPEPIPYFDWFNPVVYGQIAFVAMFFLLRDRKRMELASVLITWCGVGLALVNFVEFWDRSLVNLSSVPGRSAGLMVNANPSGAAILASFILSYMVPQRFLLFKRAIMFVGMYTTFSRTAFLLFGLFLVYQELLVHRLNVRRLSLAAVLVSGMVVFLMNAESFNEASKNKHVLKAYNRIEALEGGSFDDSSSRQRLKVIQVNMGRFMEHPLLGGGHDYASLVDTPHNQFLFIMAEYGAVGLSFFLVFLWILTRDLLRLEGGPEKRLALAIHLFLVLNMLVTHNEYHYRFYIILNSMLCAATVIFPRREISFGLSKLKPGEPSPALGSLGVRGLRSLPPPPAHDAPGGALG